MYFIIMAKKVAECVEEISYEKFRDPNELIIRSEIVSRTCTFREQETTKMCHLKC